MIKTYKCSAALMLVLLLAGCVDTESSSSSDDDTDSDPIVMPLESIDGTWISNCIVETLFNISTDLSFVAKEGELSSVTTVYGNLTCGDAELLIQETVEFTYVLGGVVTVDGSVDGITSATEIDLINATAGSADFGAIGYELIGVTGDFAYFGDCDGADACTTADLRATQLDGSVVFTLQ
jgi:hypothetical protein